MSIKDKYMLGSLCSTSPIILTNNMYGWAAGNIISYNTNKFTSEVIKITKDHNIYKNYSYIRVLTITDKIFKNIPMKQFFDKDSMCMHLLSKINFAKNVFVCCNNQNGLLLLSKNADLNKFANYSNNIYDYRDGYTKLKIEQLLLNINKLISQNSICISEYQINTFKNILHMLLQLEIDSKWVDIINLTLTDVNIFIKIYYKYMINSNYYINLGELFKNV